MNHPKTLIVLIGLFLLCQVGFFLISREIEQVSGSSQILDTRFSYTAAEANRILTDLGEHGRRLYYYALTIDLVYPLVYSLLLFYLLQWALSGGAVAPPQLLHRLRFLPFTAAVLDYLENSGELYMLSHYPTGIAGAAPYVSLATTLKWFLVAGSVLLLIVAFLFRFRNRPA